MIFINLEKLQQNFKVWVCRPALSGFAEPLRYPHLQIRVPGLQCRALLFDCTARSVQMAKGHSSCITYHRYYPPTHIHTRYFNSFILWLLALGCPCPFQAHSNKLTPWTVVKGEVMLLAAWKTMYPNTFRKKKKMYPNTFLFQSIFQVMNFWCIHIIFENLN